MIDGPCCRLVRFTLFRAAIKGRLRQWVHLVARNLLIVPVSVSPDCRPQCLGHSGVLFVRIPLAGTSIDFAIVQLPRVAFPRPTPVLPLAEVFALSNRKLGDGLLDGETVLTSQTILWGPKELPPSACNAVMSSAKHPA